LRKKFVDDDHGRDGSGHARFVRLARCVYSVQRCGGTAVPLLDSGDFVF
jgi:hypothetical protein